MFRFDRLGRRHAVVMAAFALVLILVITVAPSNELFLAVFIGAPPVLYLAVAVIADRRAWPAQRLLVWWGLRRTELILGRGDADSADAAIRALSAVRHEAVSAVKSTASFNPEPWRQAIPRDASPDRRTFEHASIAVLEGIAEQCRGRNATSELARTGKQLEPALGWRDLVYLWTLRLIVPAAYLAVMVMITVVFVAAQVLGVLPR